MSVIAAAVHAWVQKSPDKEALHFHDPDGLVPDEVMSYGLLWKRACAIADCLQELPLGAEIMLVLPLGAPLLVCHLAVQLHGGVASIFTHPSEKIRPEVFGNNLKSATSILRPRAIIVSREFLPYVAAVMDGASIVLIWEDFGGSAHFKPTGWHRSTSNDPAIMQYSSGSTGLQKCVGLSHDKVLRQCESYGHFINLSSQHDRVCSWLPLYHDMGLFTSWLLPLTQGVPVSLMDPFKWVRNPTSLLRLLQDTRSTLCWQPNFAFRLIQLRSSGQEAPRYDLRTVRGLTNCSEPVSAKVMSDFRAAFQPSGLREDSLWVCYAMAENAFAVTACGGSGEPYRTAHVDRDGLANGSVQIAEGGREIASCGVPIDGCELTVVDDLRNDLPAGRVGEICIRSPFLMTGYVRNEELSRSAISDAGLFYTGDLGFMLDRHLYVTGRKKDLIIVGGRNFYPQDLESCATSCVGAIAGRAVAIGVDDVVQGTQRVVMIVESRLTDKEKISALATKIRVTVLQDLDCAVSEVHVVPHMWLLKTSSGKIARQPNLERYSATIGATEKADSSPVPSLSVVPAFAQPILWGAAAAVAVYFYTLFFLLGDSKSWNVYAGF